jgi:prophage regulatory protein
MEPHIRDLQLLTIRDVMQLLRLGRMTLYRWVAVGKFPQPIKIGIRGDNRWRLSDIEAWRDSASNEAAIDLRERNYAKRPQSNRRSESQLRPS